MKIFDAWKLTSILHRIEWARTELIKHEIDKGNRDSVISQEVREEWLNTLILDTRELASKAELPSTNSRVNEYGGLPIALEGDMTYQELDYELKVLRGSIQFDLIPNMFT